MKKVNSIVYFLSLLVFYVAAIYRLAILISIDTGPLGIFEKIRTYIYNKYFDTQSEIWENINEGINCTDCTGVWASFLLVPVLYLATKWRIFGLIVFALGGAGLQHYITNRNNGEDEFIV